VCAAALLKFAKSGNLAKNFAEARFSKNGRMQDLPELGPKYGTFLF